jgi:hypothetical protein
MTTHNNDNIVERMFCYETVYMLYVYESNCVVYTQWERERKEKGKRKGLKGAIHHQHTKKIIF